MKYIAIIGHGAIAQAVIQRLQNIAFIKICGLICRAESLNKTKQNLANNISVVSSFEALSYRPDLILDCAGHSGLQMHGHNILTAGIELITVSAGALADPLLHTTLAQAAIQGKTRLRVIPGAVGGLDILSAARQGHISYVTYQSRKSPENWRGTPAENYLNLDTITKPTVHFIGNAREAAKQFPQNANVAASIALAGIGFEKTQVKLIADPTCADNRHDIEVKGNFGHFSIQIAGKPLPNNPKSSALTAMSIVRTVLSNQDPILVI